MLDCSRVITILTCGFVDLYSEEYPLPTQPNKDDTMKAMIAILLLGWCQSATDSARDGLARLEEAGRGLERAQESLKVAIANNNKAIAQAKERLKNLEANPRGGPRHGGWLLPPALGRQPSQGWPAAGLSSAAFRRPWLPQQPGRLPPTHPHGW